MPDDYPSWSDLSGSDNQGLEPTDGQKPKQPNQLIASLSQPFDNIGSNLSRTYGNFSSGNIGHGLADTAELIANPTGGWGQQAKDKDNNKTTSLDSKSDEPTFLPEHLNPPNANGISTFNKDGEDFINQHIQNYTPQSQAVGIPQLMGSSDSSQGKSGIIGNAVNSSASAGVSSLIAAFL